MAAHLPAPQIRTAAHLVSLLDPREGQYHCPDDVLAIQPVLERVALEYQEYEDCVIEQPTPTPTPTPPYP